MFIRLHCKYYSLNPKPDHKRKVVVKSSELTAEQFIRLDSTSKIKNQEFLKVILFVYVDQFIVVVVQCLQ
jgi:hypothetical protein